MVSAPVPATRGFNCRNCGAAVELRALTHTRSVACTTCAALLDPRDPNLVILQEAKNRQRYEPLIPLGVRGTLDGHPFAAIGFQYRDIEVDGERYGWTEYVLFNPYQGFRYLSEYQGHWNYIRTLQRLPTVIERRKRSTATVDGGEYRHFQSAAAVTRFVLGEFPWRVRVGDTVHASDYVAPPLLLSSEQTADEVTWSRGQYMTGDAIWKAFDLPGIPPRAQGVFANQPSPYSGRAERYWRVFGVLFLLLLGLLIWRSLTADREPVFDQQYSYMPKAGVEPAFTTETFTIRDGGTVEVDLEASLNNAWLYVDLALLNTETGTALNLGREVEQYSGTDADGPWVEGSGRATFLVPWVPAGQYYLRVEPQGAGPTGYRLRLRRDVVSLWPYIIAFVLILVPPLWIGVKDAGFEARRWQESDHGPGG
jgi:hypothetical protein